MRTEVSITTVIARLPRPIDRRSEGVRRTFRRRRHITFIPRAERGVDRAKICLGISLLARVPLAGSSLLARVARGVAVAAVFRGRHSPGG